MFGLFKKAAVTTAVAGTLAVAAVAGSPPAPAQALVPLIPIAIAGAAGTAGTTVSVGGMIAGLTAIGGTIGLGLAISQPGSNPIKDWLGEEVSNPWEFFFGKDTNGDGKLEPDTEKEVPTVADPNGSATPSQNGYVWETANVTMDAMGTQNAAQSTLQLVFRHTQAVEMSYYPTFRAEWECMATSGAVRTLAETRGGSMVVQKGLSSVRFKTDSLNCATGEKLVAATVRSVTTAEKAQHISPSYQFWDQMYGPKNTRSWKSALHPGYAQPQILAEATCVAPDGTRAKISLATDLNPDGSMPSNINIPSCKAAGLGDVAESLNVGWADGDKVKQPIFTATPSDPMLDCDPAFGQVCKLEIYVDGKACVVGSPACVSWAGLARSNPARVKCMYGGKAVDMSACAVMEGAYLKGGTPAVKENVDGDPDTWKIPATVPGWQPHIETEEGPRPDPNPDPNLDPAPNPNPDPETPGIPDPAPEPPVTTDPNGPVANPQAPPQGQNGNCWANSSAWNPIEWVYQPVLCALNAAFVPKTPIQARLDGMAGQFSNKVPLSWFGVGLEPVAGGSCPTSWVIEWIGQAHSLICGTAADGIIQTFRPVLGGMLVMAAVWPLMRSLFYSSIPVLKVTPS